MTVADWVLAAALLLAVIGGWRWGTINVIAKVGSLILAYQAARIWSTPLAVWAGRWLPEWGGRPGNAEGEKLTALLSLLVDPDSLANRLVEIAAFIVIFVVVCWLVRRIARGLTGLFRRGLLGRINQALGAFCAVVLMVALILIVTEIVLPAGSVLGLSAEPLRFLEDSAIILPALRTLPALLS